MGAIVEQLASGTLAALQPQISELELAGVPAFEVRPRDFEDDGSILFHIHGGGFVLGGGRAVLLMASLNAAYSGRRVVSIDYSLAPRARWRTIIDELVKSWSTLVDERQPSAIGMVGESAGGCLALAANLVFRDQGLRQPDALVLQSPVVDLGQRGDTNMTLQGAGTLDVSHVMAGFRAYADESEFDNPLVSPIYGEFSNFPPTLIQAGTREFLLSDSVRLHRSLRRAGRESRIEIYEGMPHVFQLFLAGVQEGREAWEETGSFWRNHLG